MQGYTQYTASTTSAVTMGVPPNTIAEEYIPLWVYSSGTTADASATTTAYLRKSGVSTSTTTSAVNQLHTLSINWASNQKFAFEVSAYSNGASYTAYIGLYDLTGTPTLVTGSQVSTNATTAILLRSGSFTLIPGHVYGVGMYSNSGSGEPILTKAHLVALMM